MFGPLSESYTLRRFWGTFWHQQLRDVRSANPILLCTNIDAALQMLSTWNKYLVKILKIKRGTWFSSRFQLYNGFFLSGLLHAITACRLPFPEAHKNGGKYTPFLGGDQLVGYVAQAAAIHFEDFVISFFKDDTKPQKTPGYAVRILGFAWVSWWIYMTAPLSLDEATLGGMCETPPLSYRLIGRALIAMGVQNVSTTACVLLEA
jgi:Membrane bound O-acyl transferase family